MTRMFGQQVLFENIAGASGTLAAARAAKADPDGYTFMGASYRSRDERRPLP